MMGEQSQPTTVAILIATAIVSGLTGYFAGQGSFLGLFSGPSTRRPSFGSESGSDEPESEEQDGDEQLSSFDNDSGECKLVLVVRTDLGMTKGELRIIRILMRNKQIDPINIVALYRAISALFLT